MNNIKETLEKMDNLIISYKSRLDANDKLLGMYQKRVQKLEEDKKSLEISSNILGIIVLVFIVLNGAQLILRL